MFWSLIPFWSWPIAVFNSLAVFCAAVTPATVVALSIWLVAAVDCALFKLLYEANARFADSFAWATLLSPFKSFLAWFNWFSAAWTCVSFALLPLALVIASACVTAVSYACCFGWSASL